MTTTTYHVNGMTCGHCVSAVKDELSAMAGVTAVDVDLVPGEPSPVTITSAEPLDDAAVRDAIDEAGYVVA
jgi:copper chaperone